MTPLGTFWNENEEMTKLFKRNEIHAINPSSRTISRRLINFYNVIFLRENHLKEKLVYFDKELNNITIFKTLKDYIYSSSNPTDIAKRSLKVSVYIEGEVLHKSCTFLKYKRIDPNKIIFSKEFGSFFYPEPIFEVVKIENLTKSEEEKLVLFGRGASLGIANLLVEAKLLNNNGERFYKRFTKKTSTKVREIYEPVEPLKRALKIVNEELFHFYYAGKSLGSQFAYLKKRSIKDNIAVHSDPEYRYTLKADIKSFFDNCKEKEVLKYLAPLISSKSYKGVELEPFHFGLSRESHNMDNIICGTKKLQLLRLVFFNPDTDGGLYQGSPPSGILSNIVMRKVSRYLSNIFEKEGKKFSVYADDLTVSSKKKITKFEKKRIIGAINYVFSHYNLPFELKEEKTIVHSGHKRKITGLRVNHENKIIVPRSKYKEMRDICISLERGEFLQMMPVNVFKGKFSYCLSNDKSGKFNRLKERYQKELSVYGIN
jgi:hypothetical protein